MRRFTALLRRFFKPRLRLAAERDPDLPFTAEEFARLIRSGKREDMRILAKGLSCGPVVGRSRHQTAP